MTLTPTLKENWEKIEEILFDLHIRYCPLVDTQDSLVKQNDCNEVKELLRSAIKDLLSQSKSQIVEQILGEMEKTRKDEKLFDGSRTDDQEVGWNNCLDELGNQLRLQIKESIKKL